MRLMVQKVISGSIAVENVTIASIGVGLFILVGFYRDDTDKEMDYLVRKILRLRLFPDGDDRRCQLNIMEKGYEILCMSQITLHYSIKGNKIDFHTAMHPNNSRAFYERFVTKLRSAYTFEKVQTGRFGCYSNIHIINDGPMSFQLEYPQLKSDGLMISAIGTGLVVWVGMSRTDTSKDIFFLVNHILSMKIYHSVNNTRRWARNVVDVGDEILALTQLGLYTRFLYNFTPSFTHAMSRRRSRSFFAQFVTALRAKYSPGKIKEGRFTTGLSVELKHRGPMLILESPPPYYSFVAPLPIDRQPRLHFPPMSPNVHPGLPPVNEVPPSYFQQYQHPYYQQQQPPPPPPPRQIVPDTVQHFRPPVPQQNLPPPPPRLPYRDTSSGFVREGRPLQEPVQFFSPHYLYNQTDSLFTV